VDLSKPNGGNIDSRTDVLRKSLLKGETPRSPGAMAFQIDTYVGIEGYTSEYMSQRKPRSKDRRINANASREPYTARASLSHLISLSNLSPFMPYKAPVEQEGQIIERIVSIEVADFS
jgi:hypothetical protein